MAVAVPRALTAIGCVGLVGALMFVLWLPKKPATQSGILRATSKPDLQEFIAENKSSKNPKQQDLVTIARVRLAYRDAQNGNYREARRSLLLAESEHKGTGAESAEWGSLADQAAYQAIVCLAAEGLRNQAKRQFVEFMQKRPCSPLVHAVYKRLTKMDPSGTDYYNALLSQAIAKQEDRIRFETSVCGPKVIEYLAKGELIASPKLDYKEFAKRCGTTDDGTTMAGLRSGLKSVGVESYAYKLNRQDLDRTELPIILLEGDHYVAMTAIAGSEATIFDPRFQAERTIKLPASDNPDFAVNAVLFHPLGERP